MTEEQEKGERSNLFSKAVKAGKRTYFFDVKSTRASDQYITITESKKKGMSDDGKFFFEKHKIFLYREDFEKFVEGLNDAVQYIKENAPPMTHNHRHDSDVHFDDLGK